MASKSCQVHDCIIIFLMYNVLVNDFGHEGGVGGSRHSQPDATKTEVAVTGEIHLLRLS